MMRVRGGFRRRWLTLTVLIASGIVAQATEFERADPRFGHPCSSAVSRGVICEKANRWALELMQHAEGIVVVQDVRNGAVVVLAASHPSDLDVNTRMMPLSVAKLLIAASWWDHQHAPQFNAATGSKKENSSLDEMLVQGRDAAGGALAIVLRHSLGTEAVLKDFQRYGFVQKPSASDGAFWGAVGPNLKSRLKLPTAYITLSKLTQDAEWGEALSVGERDMGATVFHVSRFLQAIGNSGLMLQPIALTEADGPQRRSSPQPTRVMQASTARKLQAEMLEVVRRGTAQSIAHALDGTGWQIGGKTGSGTALLPKREQVDGWFAGLIFDPNGQARFTVVTFVRSGGYGATQAAHFSAALARYLIGEKVE